jgi:hypothetical protein
VVICGYIEDMENKTFSFFENHQTDQFEIHALNCGCIKKYISQLIIDTSNVHKINASSPQEAQLSIIAQYGYNDGGDDEITVKVFPCCKKAGE